MEEGICFRRCPFPESDRANWNIMEGKFELDLKSDDARGEDFDDDRLLADPIPEPIIQKPQLSP